jgi:uncharacterized membrane protein YjgN (DUF898 family)
MKSYFIVVCLFVAMSIAAGAAKSFLPKDSMVALSVSLLVSSLPTLLIFYFMIRARYGAYAYLVNNTSYRSIRFHAKHEAHKAYIATVLKGSVLSLLTLGIYYPFMSCELARIKWNNTSFGNRKFSYRAKNSDYASLWFKGLFLTIITLGIFSPWFMVSMHDFNMRNIRYPGARFSTMATGSDYFFLQLKTVFFLVISLGLATPYILNMNLAFYIRNLSMKGDINFDEIIQDKKSVKDQSFHDSVASILDVDVA